MFMSIASVALALQMATPAPLTPESEPSIHEINTAYLFVRPHVDTAGISALVTGCAIQTATCALKRWTPIIAAVGTGITRWSTAAADGLFLAAMAQTSIFAMGSVIRTEQCHGVINRAAKATTSVETATTRCGSQGKARQREPAGLGCQRRIRRAACGLASSRILMARAWSMICHATRCIWGSAVSASGCASKIASNVAQSEMASISAKVSFPSASRTILVLMPHRPFPEAAASPRPGRRTRCRSRLAQYR